MLDKASLFPFPNRIGTIDRDGCLVTLPPTCIDCTLRQCETSRSRDLQLCTLGFNYQRLDADVLMLGVVAREYSSTTAARTKRLREVGASAVPRQHIERAVNTYRAAASALEEAIDAEKARLVRQYQESEQYRADFLSAVRSDIQRGLALFHDYKQINTAISRNINVLVETRYSGATLADKLAAADPAERAIYEASKFLDEKLNVAKFLLTPEWLEQRDACVAFRFHGLVTKYLHIYRTIADQKKLRIRQLGESRHDVTANPQAVAVIPHTLIDNAVKYATTGSDIEIEVNDGSDFIDLTVTSWGPIIKPTEEALIFDPFFRGSGAVKVCEDGAGYGLYVSQMVAKTHMGTEIQVEQQRSFPKGDRFKTTFYVRLPIRATIL